MKRVLVLASALATFLVLALPANNAEAYWGFRHFNNGYQPRLSVSISGGAHFVDYNETTTDYMSYGVVEGGLHYWIHPNLSLDLGIGTHFLSAGNEWDGYSDPLWGYFSIKPGVRARFGIFYLRAALDLAVGATCIDKNTKEVQTTLFGMLFGAGIRIPVSRRMRFFGELNYQVLFGAAPVHMPFYGKMGLEFMF